MRHQHRHYPLAAAVVFAALLAAPAPAWAAQSLSGQGWAGFLSVGLACLGLGWWLARRRVHSSERLQKSLTDSFDGLVYICSPEHTVEYMNEALIRRTGRNAVGEPCHQVLHGLEGVCPWCNAGQVLAGETVRTEVQSPQDGRWYTVVGSPLRRADGRVAKLTLFTDITEQRQMEKALRESEKRYRTVADNTYDWELWLGQDGAVLYTSPSCERTTGFAPERFTQDPAALESLIVSEDREGWREYMQALRGAAWQTLEFRLTHQDGTVRWMSQASRRVSGPAGEDLGIRANIRDITPAKNLEQELRNMALTDPLTGLANRTLCLDRLTQALNRSRRRDNYHYAVVFMDLDRFKLVNDSYGHALGDQLLEEVARRLAHCMRSLDLVARFGSDEFVLLLEELDSPRQAVRIIKRASQELAAPIVLDGREICVTASFGVVLGPTEHGGAEDLLRNANIALHRAKESGRGKVLVFNTKMLEAAVELMTLENDLRRAVARDEFFVVYQPILDLAEGRLQGFEALVRWRHPERGVVSPAEFIPTAEDTGLIVDIGRFVLGEACRTIARWQQEVPAGQSLILAVNLSARQFADPDLVEDVRKALAESGLPPHLLKLEITETTIMEDPELTADKLNRIKTLGAQISIDDFGTGYSSMSYLQRFPLDHLKIDLSFIRSMDQAPENQEIVKAIIGLAHNLGLKVVAEGVERAGQRDLLASLNCEYGQGYHFSQPITAEEAADMLRRQAG
jgi:diguanylate cyclase (GGDEF)-like protein/PAS domain S-box-containing protein